MKTIKVFAFPSHQTKERNSGVDYARIVQPMKHLHGYEFDGVKFEVKIHNVHDEKQMDWMTIAKKYDVVYLNYTVLDWQYAAMGCFIHGEGKKIVYDLDDSMWHLRPDNITYNKMKEIDGAYVVTCMLNDVDMVTTTNRYLRNIIKDKTNKPHEKIKVFPNMVDLSFYNKTYPAKDTGTITILHYGSTSHFEDLLDDAFVGGIDKVFARYPNVKVKFIGSFIQKLKHKWGIRVENGYGDSDIHKWVNEKFPEFMSEADIVVAPLEDDKYNRAKSDIKAIESWSAGKPFVCSSVRPYTDTVEEGVNGYICSTADQWYNALSTLIESKEKRQEIGNNGYEYVKKERQIELLLPEYAKMFIEVMGG